MRPSSLFVALTALLPSLASAVTLGDLQSADAPYTVSEGISRGGVTVFPVVQRGVAKLADDQRIVSLQDALATGQLAVTEVGHQMQVASLRVHNRGKHPVLVMAGEVVQGGQQDRVMAEDLLLPPSDAPVTVTVNCVEQGRWGGGHQFGYGGQAELSLRRVVQMQGDQSATWREVARVNSAKAGLMAQMGHGGAALRPSTGTYLASMRSPLERQVSKIAEELSLELAKEGEVVGVVVAVGDHIVGSEVYGYTEVFDSVRDATLSALAREALSSGSYGSYDDAPSAQVAADYLSGALMGHAVALESRAGTTRHQLRSEDVQSFLLADAEGEVLRLVSYSR